MYDEAFRNFANAPKKSLSPGIETFLYSLYCARNRLFPMTSLLILLPDSMKPFITLTIPLASFQVYVRLFAAQSCRAHWKYGVQYTYTRSLMLRGLDHIGN